MMSSSMDLSSSSQGLIPLGQIKQEPDLHTPSRRRAKLKPDLKLKVRHVIRKRQIHILCKIYDIFLKMISFPISIIFLQLSSEITGPMLKTDWLFLLITELVYEYHNMVAKV